MWSQVDYKWLYCASYREANNQKVYTHKVSSIEVAYNIYNSISLWPQGVPKHMAY